MESLGGVDAYVVGDKSCGRAVLVASDILGIHSGRHKAICDELAAEGFVVVMPDFFRGAFPDEGTAPPWWKLLLQAPGLITPLSTPWAKVQEDLERLLPFLADCGPVGILGFCWGAWVVIRACGTFPDVFVCGASAHPSVHSIAGLRGEREEELLAQVKAPQLVLATKDEPAGWKPGGAAEAVLKQVSSGHVFKEIGAVNHGFVPRGDLTDPVMAEAVSTAMSYIKGFFGNHIRREP